MTDFADSLQIFADPGTPLARLLRPRSHGQQ
jgi:hypothetical protein